MPSVTAAVGGTEVSALPGPSQVMCGGGRQRSFSRAAAKPRRTGTLRQLNPDFLSQLPVPRPRGLGKWRASAAGHKSTLSLSNCTSSSCLK